MYSNTPIQLCKYHFLISLLRGYCYSDLMLKICIYIPESHLETVKLALFDAGAGKIGHYDRCCWQVAGQGQFRPLDGSDPYIGEQGVVENVIEYKVEMVCDDKYIKQVIVAMKEAHPYEEPAYDVIKLEAV